MRSYVASACALALLFGACGGSGEAGPTSTPVSQSLGSVATESSSSTQGASATTRATQPPTTTTTTKFVEIQEPPEGVELTVLSDSVVLWDYPNEPASVGYLNDELAFTLVHSCGDCFAGGKQMTREPNGVLSVEGWRAGMWSVGAAGQIEINHLWPPDSPLRMDVLWLTSWTGMTEETLTGFTPEAGETFTLWDEIVLETRNAGKGLFGLHADCRIGEDIAAVLLSFEGQQPVPLVGWGIDYESMTFARVADPSNIEVGDCYEPAARP